MRQYLDLCRHILENGVRKEDRTGTGTISVFGVQTRYNLQEGFPLLTTKKMFHKAIIHELLWFIKGDTNIKYLVDNGVRIWNEWPYENFRKSSEFNNETIEDFVEKIKNSEDFAKKFGDLGPVYGKQWRDFNGVDQLANLIQDIKTNPNSRRLILTAWNPVDVPKMALPPCHTLLQFSVEDNKLSCQLYQRSGDVFLGVPFNIASYSLLIHLIAKVCDLEVGEFIHTMGDAHIYLNHLAQVEEQLKREPMELCKLELAPKKNIEDFTFEDVKFLNYSSHPTIKGEVSV